jgi:hypothetical protein
MALFNDNLLVTSWDMRLHELKAQRLQAYNDMLYEHLRADFTSRAATLQDSLLEVIRTAPYKEALSIPLWTFHSTYIVNLSSAYNSPGFSEFQDMLRDKGYEWTVGAINPESVSRIVKPTDLLDRLALLFGNNFRVTTAVVDSERLTEPFEACVYRYELRLQYFPRGVSTALREKQDAVRAKYAPPPEVGFSNVSPPLPATPPPAPLAGPPGAPLRLPMRSNGGGIDACYGYSSDEEGDGCRRRLNFSAACHCCTGADDDI